MSRPAPRSCHAGRTADRRVRAAVPCRVQYSGRNHLHVDIFPFHDDGSGQMTKRTWMETHRQDMPFPRAYLEPIERMSFVGVDAPVPNSAREFLEMKFGKGAVETPDRPA